MLKFIRRVNLKKPFNFKEVLTSIKVTGAALSLILAITAIPLFFEALQIERYFYGIKWIAYLNFALWVAAGVYALIDYLKRPAK